MSKIPERIFVDFEHPMKSEIDKSKTYAASDKRWMKTDIEYVRAPKG